MPPLLPLVQGDGRTLEAVAVDQHPAVMKFRVNRYRFLYSVCGLVPSSGR